MDNTKKHVNASPQIKANPISKLFFWWMMPFLLYGYKNDIEMKDIYNTPKDDMSEQLTDTFERNWNQICKKARKNNKRPSLRAAIIKTFWKPYAIAGFINLLRMSVYTYAMPTAIRLFISYFSEVQRDPQEGWRLGLIVLLINFLNSAIIHHCRVHKKRVGIRAKVACGALIYRKILRLNKQSLDDIDVGKVVNLLSNDLSRFDRASEFLDFLFIMPVVAIIGTYVMYEQVGKTAFLGITVMMIQAVPFQGYLSKLQGKFRYKIAERTDSRIKLMNEITAGIQVIKMYAWEKPFEKMVSSLRAYEIKAICQTSYIKAISLSIEVITDRLTRYIIIVIFVLSGHELSGGIVFALTQVIDALLITVCILFPAALSSYNEAKTSLYRMEDFLIKEEREEKSKIENVEDGMVKLENVHAIWAPSCANETLSDISLDLKPGSFCCIVGNVGSGKSSILHLLLKELPQTSGTVQVGGKVSYAAQEPWLFVSNVRNNILFGLPYEKDKYNRVIKACALERDFELFPYGDKTLVGEKGVSLSGGQRARINLARAVYREADIYLLDDPLSAVDPHVSKHLMEQCIGGYLSNKTRILVTHQTQFLHKADYVLILENGKIQKFLRPNELTSKDQTIITKTQQNDETSSNESVKIQELANSVEQLAEDPEETTELIGKGTITFDVYKHYYRAGASRFVIFFEIFALILAQTFGNSGDLWITYWTNNADMLTMMKKNALNVTSEIKNISTPPPDLLEINKDSSNIIDKIGNFFDPKTLTQDIYIKVYTLFIILTIILTLIRSTVFFRICMNASKKLHDLMFENILQAKMSFFDANPSGRILNRFSKDMGTMDELLPVFTLAAIQYFFIGSGILVMIFIKSVYMVPPALVLGVLVFWFRKVFFKASQDLKRLEAISKAPVFSYVAATLDGLPTIRSAKAETLVKKEFDVVQDENTSTNYLFIFALETFMFYLDMIAFAFLGVVVVQFLLNPNALSGDVGLVLSQSLIIVLIIQLTTAYMSDVENNMTSVERVLQYTHLNKEGPFETLPGNKPPRDWPESGRVVFKNVYLRYSVESEPILKNLNFVISPGEKIGIVGRTGAGKSTLISALFRLAEIDGTIQIDGVDTEKIGLTELRSKISIIPQEPILFSESVRYNLDPFGKSDDQTLWKALEAVELKNGIESLDFKVTEGGSNFSAGQRQLICLARAIVRNNRILVMDEATANVDPYTDSLIQKSIKENFKNCTVLTIAHRLNTIMDSDRVIVMDAGQLKEFSAPHELLQNSEGYFSSMVKETGPVMEEKLRSAAEKHFKSKNKE